MARNTKYFLTALLFAMPFFWGINVAQKSFDAYLTAQISKPLENVFIPAMQEKQRPPLEINASSAISLQISANGTQKILLTKNPDKPLPIASITKLMTAVIVMDNPGVFDYARVITISKAAAEQGNTPNFGNLKAGEKYTLEKLLELMVVYSSNDSAYALAEIIGVDNFVDAMNQKAAKLGMNYTYFLNPNGLDPKNIPSPEVKDLNYSTASDLVKLAEYILNYKPEIFEIAARVKDLHLIENGLSGVSLAKGQLLGGKTGYTKNAKGGILFVFQNQKGNIFINVILGMETEEARITEMQKLADWLNF